MSKTKNYCFSANRICHHDDYYLLLSKLINIENIKDIKRKINILFSKDVIFYLDIDSLDLMFFPLILLRTIWGGKGVAISVRTEYLLESRSLKEFLFQRRRLIYLKSLVKRFLFYVLKKYSSTEILSIHKKHKKTSKLAPYVNDFIFDPQLWDLKILNIISEKPKEIVNDDIFNKKNDLPILVAGRFDAQRSKNELISYLKKGAKYNFIIAGKIDDQDLVEIKSLENCTIINRFISNEELIYLYEKCYSVYCFYSNDRPSGFFGRALQFNKPIIVRKNRFLHLMFKEYRNLIAVEKLEELENMNISYLKEDKGFLYYDDSEYFIKILKSKNYNNGYQQTRIYCKNIPCHYWLSTRCFFFISK